MELTSKNVQELFTKCLYNKEIRDGETTENVILIEGIVHNYGLDKTSVENEKENISSMLHQLPKEFMEATGGGYSFLAACNNADGVQWTGMHLVMESLFVLGMAAGIVKCLLPRDFWPMLPGSVPYYVVTD